MRVVLIPVPIMDYRDDVLTPIAQDETKNCPPYGVYLLVNVLRAAGHEVTLIDLIAEGTNRVDHHRSLFNATRAGHAQPESAGHSAAIQSLVVGAASPRAGYSRDCAAHVRL